MAKLNLNKLQKDLNAQETDIRLKQGASFVGSSNDPFSTPTRDNAQTYPYDYFAGTDCKIFFGDIWVDDIVTIQYNVTQSKTPIYGYASQNFDAVARGQVLVEGTLAISFKETGYLNLIQAQLDAQKRQSQTGIQSKIQKLSDDKIKKYIPGINSINENGAKIDFTYSATGTPEIIKQEQTIEQILANKKGKPNSSSSAMDKTFKINKKGSRDFEDFAEILEDSIWGDSNGKFLELEDKLKRVDEFDYNHNGGITTAKNTSYADVLNIMLTFGDINDYRAEHTITVLNDVHFISTSMMVSPDGNPIAEVYNFIARDINKSITSKTKNLQLSPTKLTVGNDQILISKLADVDAIQNTIEMGQSVSVILFVESVFKDNKWEPWGGKSTGWELGPEKFLFNKITPFIDQLCNLVEEVINSSFDKQNNTSSVGPTLLKKLSDYEQLIASVDFSVPGFTSEGQKLTLILEQGIIGTYTFRVISPTRSGFGSVINISRDDLFSDLGKTPLPEKLSKEEKAKFANAINGYNEVVPFGTGDAASDERISAEADLVPDFAPDESATPPTTATSENTSSPTPETPVPAVWGPNIPPEELAARSIPTSEIEKQYSVVANNPPTPTTVTIGNTTINPSNPFNITALNVPGVNPNAPILNFPYSQAAAAVNPPVMAPINQSTAAQQESSRTTQQSSVQSNFSILNNLPPAGPTTINLGNNTSILVPSTQGQLNTLPLDPNKPVINFENYGQPSPEKIPAGTRINRPTLYNQALKEYMQTERPKTLNKVTITLTEEERQFYPFAPEKIEVEITDKIAPKNIENAGGLSYAGGVSRSPGRIAIARTDDPNAIAEVLAHELIHQDQYGRYGKNWEAYEAELRQGQYRERRAEIEAYKEAGNAGQLLSSTRSDLIQTIVRDYDPWQDPRANISFYRDENGNIVRTVIRQ